MRLERTVSWSQTRRDTNFAIPGYSVSAIISRRGRKSKIFLSVVIPVVKAAFVPFSAIGPNPANAGATRLCGVSPHPIPDTATALPNQARYQLRYTRIFNFCHYTTAEWKIKDFSVCGHSCGQNRFCAVFGNRRKTRYRPCCKALRRFTSPYPGYRHGTPKPPALPTALHPVMKFPPLETTHASDLTFILYINTAQSAIFFSARLPRQSYYCAEGSDAALAASEPSAEAAPYKSKPSFFSLFRTADVLRLISAAISLIGTALLHMSAARSSCS